MLIPMNYMLTSCHCNNNNDDDDDDDDYDDDDDDEDGGDGDDVHFLTKCTPSNIKFKVKAKKYTSTVQQGDQRMDKNRCNGVTKTM